MPEEENSFRKFQRSVRDAKRSVSKQVENSAFRIPLTEAIDDVGKTVSSAYKTSGVDVAVEKVTSRAGESYNAAKNKLVQLDKTIGLRDAAESVRVNVNQGVSKPVKQYLDDVGATEAATAVARSSGDAYGSARKSIKPYFEPEDARELLQNTQSVLTRITACILQVSYKDAEGWLGEFGRLISAKVAGVASTVTVFGLVSLYGTAGTGTAIASLSGAAATNATLASVGGLVGGGMAAGALVLSGIGILVGIGAYKLLSSEARDFETLPEQDRQIVETCGMLSAALQEELDKNELKLTSDETVQFLEQSLVPFQRYLEENEEPICSRLDNTNATIFRQHVLRDFQPIVIDGFRSYAKTAPISVQGLIGGVFYALLTNSALDGSSEQLLVLDALRRSTTSLQDATEAELGEYLSSLAPDQMRGVASNVKGIYHEMRHVEQYNAEHVETYAVLHEATNQQGSDVQIFSTETGELYEEYQLKATDSSSYVREHQSRYENIEIKTTEEVAARVEGAETSGLSNTEMNMQVNGVFGNVADNSISDRIVESAELSGLVNAGFAALDVLKGKSSATEASKHALKTVVNAAAATGITAYLFS